MVMIDKVDSESQKRAIIAFKKIREDVMKSKTDWKLADINNKIRKIRKKER